MPRQTWEPAPSMCLDLPGFTAVDQYPIRSPLNVADFLSTRVKGKKLCEIGTRNGDIMACLSHFTSKATAIELDPVYCKKLRERGLEIFCKPVETVSPQELEHCEVYFWWPMDARSQNEAWLRQLLQMHNQNGKNATAYVAHDTHYDHDMHMLPKLAQLYNGKINRVFFDEGGGLRGSPSYTNPFYGRPGRWGVFHVAEFELGPLVNIPPSLSEKTKPRRIRPQSEQPLPSEAKPGFCSITDNDSGVGDCQNGEKGTVMLRTKPWNIETIDDCVDFCFHYCGRCKYISYSAKERDCSWYSECNIQQLTPHSGAAFVSREVRPNAEEPPDGAGRYRGGRRKVH